MNPFPATVLKDRKQFQKVITMRFPVRSLAYTLPPLAMLLLSACSTASVDATQFRNGQTGEVVAACGPMQGFAGPLHEAQQGCISSYKDKGWTVVGG